MQNREGEAGEEGEDDKGDDRFLLPATAGGGAANAGRLHR